MGASYSGSVSSASPKSHTFTSTDTGPISAQVDWNPSTKSQTWNNSVGDLSSWTTTIEASSSGTLTASVTWPSAPINPDLDLYLKDGSTTLASSEQLTGNTEQVSYQVPSSVTLSSKKTYTWEVKAKTTGSSFTLSSTWPVTADVDLELWRGSTLVTKSNSATSKPESISASDQPPATYTLKVISKDHSASYSASASYQKLDFASITMQLKDSQGSVLKSETSSTGSLTLTHTLPSGGDYTLAIKNNSSDLSVPGYDLDTTAPRTHQAQASFKVLDSQGDTVASTAGASPQEVLQDLPEGHYKLEVIPLSGSADAQIQASYPGALAIAYDGWDHAAQIDDGGTRIEETLSPSGRVIERKVTDLGSGETIEHVLYGYADEGDSPAYALPAGGAVTTYIGGPGGLLAIIEGVTPTYPLVNGHGDVIGQTDEAGAFTSYPDQDEFGVGADNDSRLGYVGSHERFQVGVQGLIRMGMRLYDPALGRFLAVDPIEGGSANDYDYANQDPVNRVDLTGEAPVLAVVVAVAWRLLVAGFLAWAAYRCICAYRVFLYARRRAFEYQRANNRGLDFTDPRYYHDVQRERVIHYYRIRTLTNCRFLIAGVIARYFRVYSLVGKLLGRMFR